MGDKGYNFGDDRPKQNPWRDDRLGYAPFAKRLAQVLIRMRASNGYVIGLQGRWGSGKSTVINFVLEHLNKHNQENDQDQITLIDFRPWIISGHQDLVTAYFKVIAEALDPAKESKDGRLKKLLQRTRSGTDGLVDAVTSVALAAHPAIGAAAGVAGSLAKTSIGNLVDRFIAEPSLQSAYENLRVQLERSERRFVITIDDIDRLEIQEIWEIMRLVKSIGQLPNVVYLLSYDRDIVWNALSTSGHQSGPKFAEKIIQQELELPQPSQGALLALLSEEASFLPIEGNETDGWSYIVRDGLSRWVGSPRDVVRLSNALKFSWPALEGEIDPQDLLAMEGLRLFDGAVYSWVRENRDFFFGEGRYLLANEELRTSAVNALKKRVGEDVQDQVLRVLSELFPSSQKWFVGDGFSTNEANAETIARRGIGTEAGYDAYFALHPSADAIPKSVIDAVVSSLNNADALEAIFDEYLTKRIQSGRQAVSELLRELRARFRSRTRPLQPSLPLLNVLFSIGEKVIGMDRGDAMFEISPRSEIDFLVRALLEKWQPDAVMPLQHAFRKANSVAFMAEVYVNRGRELGIFHGSSDSPLIAESDLASIGLILSEKILAARNDGSLSDAPYFFNIVRAWTQLSGPEKAKEWLEQGMQASSVFFAKVSRGLVSYTIGGASRHYTMRDVPDSALYDLAALRHAGLAHRHDPKLSQDERDLIEAIVFGTEALLSGKTVDELDLDEED